MLRRRAAPDTMDPLLFPMDVPRDTPVHSSQVGAGLVPLQEKASRTWRRRRKEV